MTVIRPEPESPTAWTRSEKLLFAFIAVTALIHAVAYALGDFGAYGFVVIEVSLVALVVAELTIRRYRLRYERVVHDDTTGDDSTGYLDGPELYPGESALSLNDTDVQEPYHDTNPEDAEDRYSGECPSCGTMLFGVTVKEGMRHLHGCQEVEWYGHVVMGVKPGLADRLYMNLTGKELKDIGIHGQEDRIRYYWGHDP